MSGAVGFGIAVGSGVAVGDSLSTKLQPLNSASRIAARSKEKALEGIALIRSPLMAGIVYFVGLYHWQKVVRAG